MTPHYTRLPLWRRVVHAPVGAIVWTVARMPFRLLYALADVTDFMLRAVIRYRRRIVRGNIDACFPEMDEKARRKVEREFYRNFADYFFESLKLAHISDKAMRSRMTFSGFDRVTPFLRQGRTVTAYFAHCGNWEWVPSITLCNEGPEAVEGAVFAQVYRPLDDKWFDNLFLRLRSRFGSVSIKKKNVLRELLHWRRDSVPSITGFMSDQKPSHNDPDFAVSFLGRPTLFITGTETLARKLGSPVVYFDISKPSRGHYHVDVVLMCTDASATRPGQLTDTYTALLQRTIRRNPAIWLWSHNRWRKKPSGPIHTLDLLPGFENLRP